MLFDNDGVLVMSEPLHWDAWGKLLVEVLGIPYSKELVSSLAGKTGPEILRTVLDAHKPGWTEKDYPLQLLTDKKNEFYARVAREELKIYPGIQPLLEFLRARGIGRAVVSNARRKELEMALSVTGITELFDCILSRDDVARPKPDPMAYETAAAALGFSAHECWVVEDSPSGLSAGLLAGATCIGILSNFDRSYLENPVPGRPDLKPAAIFGSAEELWEWVQGL